MAKYKWGEGAAVRVLHAPPLKVGGTEGQRKTRLQPELERRGTCLGEAGDLRGSGGDSDIYKYSRDRTGLQRGPH